MALSAYRTPARTLAAPRGATRRPFDAEGAVALALLTLAGAPRVLVALARHEAFDAETTVCALLLGFALASSLGWAGTWLSGRWPYARRCASK